MDLLLRKLYFGFIAILMLSELAARNLYSLLFQIERPAATMAISVEAARHHMLTLVFLDAIPMIGASMVLWALRRSQAVYMGHIGVLITTLGLLLFSVYQFWYATFVLGSIKGFTQVASVVYLLLGIASWYVGKDFREKLSST